MPNHSNLSRIAIGVLVVLALGMAGCSDGDAGAPSGGDTPDGGDGGRPLVAVSFAVLADIVANVASDRVEVWSVIPSGADAHTYEASPQDIARLSQADYLVTVGGRFEAFAERSAWRQEAEDAGIPTLALLDVIEPGLHEDEHSEDDHSEDEHAEDGHDHDHGDGDPHFWLDPQHVLEALPAIAAALGEADPEGAAYFEEQAERYAAAVAEADAELEAAVSSIPEERRILIVHHDAYSYLADRFGFAVRAVLPGSGTTDASPADLAEIYDEIEASQVPAVFREPQYQSSVLDRLASDRHVEVGVLMTDAFTEDVTTYLDLIRFNARSLAEHLG